MKLNTEYTTIKGKRKNNQDSFLLHKFNDKKTGLLFVLAVADGMGGTVAGEIASKIAVDKLKKAVEEDLKKQNPSIKLDIYRFVKDLYLEINDAILFNALANPSREGMGTTLTTVFIFENLEYYVANIGDSRAYIISEDDVVQLTEDHDVETDSYKKGIDAGNKSNIDLYANALTRFLGDNDYSTVDLFGPKHLSINQKILLCSDGFYKFVNENEIPGHLFNNKNLNIALKLLVDKALMGNSNDNITLVVIENGKSKYNYYKGDKSSVRPVIFLIVLLFLSLTLSFFIYNEITNNIKSVTQENFITSDIFQEQRKKEIKNPTKYLSPPMSTANSAKILNDSDSSIKKIDNSNSPFIKNESESNKDGFFKDVESFEKKGELLKAKSKLINIISTQISDATKMDAYYKLGDINYQLNLYKEADTAYDEAIKLGLSPRIAEYYLKQGISKFETKKFWGAIKILDEALYLKEKWINPNTNILYFNEDCLFWRAQSALKLSAKVNNYLIEDTLSDRYEITIKLNKEVNKVKLDKSYEIKSIDDFEKKMDGLINEYFAFANKNELNNTDKFKKFSEQYKRFKSKTN